MVASYVITVPKQIRLFPVLPWGKILLIEGYLHLLRRHPVGTPNYKDIIDVLKAVNEIDRVQAHIHEAPNEEAATSKAAAIERPSTTERPSMSTTLARHGSRPPVATPQVVPTPDPSPSTPHPSLSPNIPSPTLHPSPAPNIPPPIPHPCPGSDILPPTPRSFPELSPIPSFDLGIDPTFLDMHTEPPSHNMSTGLSSSIDPPHIDHVQADIRNFGKRGNEVMDVVKGESVRWTNSSRSLDARPLRAFIMKSIHSFIICISTIMYGGVVSATDERLVSYRSCLLGALLPSNLS
ncbi:hypothetical protein SO802_007879 [Lithocarpus litseifolius]|uniref:Uncharacterized protein n=1 Tax=Lithocarpus litseifolius TaxID=425828 RepID=A0AAW2DVL4_9ROSI